METGVAEPKSRFGLSRFDKQGFMANRAWLLIVCLGTVAVRSGWW